MGDETVLEAVEWVATLPGSAFARLREDMTGPEAFHMERERIEPLSIRIGCHPDVARKVVGVLARLYLDLHGDGPEHDVAPVLADAVDRLAPPGKGRLEGGERQAAASRLAILLAHRPSADLRFAKDRAIRGFIPSAREFDTMLDLRPVMGRDGESIDALVPLLQLRIRAAADDPSDRERTYQLDRTAMRRLRAALDAAEMRFRTIERDPALAPLVRGLAAPAPAPALPQGEGPSAPGSMP